MSYLPVSTPEELKEDYREMLVLNNCLDLRNVSELSFINVDNNNVNEILMCAKDWNHKSLTCVYLEENNEINDNEVFYTKNNDNDGNGKSGIAQIKSISSLTDAMMHSLSQVADILIVPNKYLQNDNFYKRICFSCWLYFSKTYIVVPRDMTVKQRKKLWEDIYKYRHASLVPQFDITPNSNDIKREFKLRRKHIHYPIFEMSFMMIAWIVGIPFGLLGLTVGGISIGCDGMYTGIRYLHHKRKEQKNKV